MPGPSLGKFEVKIGAPSLGKYEVPFEPGDIPDMPIQSNPLSWWQRFKGQVWAPTPESEVKKLQGEGHEAKMNAERQVVVKQDGRWGAIHPKGLDWADVPEWLAREGVSVATQIGGAALGGAAGSAVAPGAGTVAGAMLGAGAGAAGAEATRRAIGQTLGYEDTLSQAAKDIGIEGAIGTVAEGTGQLLKPATKLVGGLLKAPSTIEKAATGVLETADYEAKRRALLTATQKLKSVTQPAMSRYAIAKAAKSEAKLRSEREALEEIARLTTAEEAKKATARAAIPIVEKTIPTIEKAGIETAEVGVASTPAKEAEEVVGKAIWQHPIWPKSLAFPDTQWTADTLRNSPQVVHVLRAIFTEDFIPEAGSWSMATRRRALSHIWNKWSKEEIEQAVNEYAKRQGDMLLGAGEKILSGFPVVHQNAIKAATEGIATPIQRRIVDEVFSNIMGKKTMPEYLQKAIKELKEATVERDWAKASRETGGIEIAKRRAELAPKSRILSQGMREGAEYLVRAPYRAPFRIAELIGNIIQKIPTRDTPKWIDEILAYGKPSSTVKRILMGVKAISAHRPEAIKVALYVAAKKPEVQQYIMDTIRTRENK